MTENIVTLLGIVLLIIVKFSEKKTETKDTNVLSACHLGIMVVIMVVIMDVDIMVVLIMVVVSSEASTLLSGLMSSLSMKRTLGQRKMMQRQPSNTRANLRFNSNSKY